MNILFLPEVRKLYSSKKMFFSHNLHTCIHTFENWLFCNVTTTTDTSIRCLFFPHSSHSQKSTVLQDTVNRGFKRLFFWVFQWFNFLAFLIFSSHCSLHREFLSFVQLIYRPPSQHPHTNAAQAFSGSNRGQSVSPHCNLHAFCVFNIIVLLHIRFHIDELPVIFFNLPPHS